MVFVLGPLFRTAGHTVRSQHGVTASSGQRRGDVEIRNYLRDQAGRRSLVFDLIVTHDCCGSSGHPLQNGLLTHPQDLHAALTVRTCLKVYGAWFLFLFLQEQIKDIIIIIVKVKAHRGKPLNERADIKAEKARPLEECRTDESHT